MQVKTFSGELVNAETGEEETFIAGTTQQIASKLRRMKDGDALVLNCHIEERDSRDFL